MKKILLMDDEARKVLNSGRTEGRCGHFRSEYPYNPGRWYVWDHRSGDLRGIRLDSEDACKYWLSKGG